MRSQQSSPRNHGLSKSRGIRKRRFGGILREISAVSDQATNILNHMATRTAQVGYLPSRSLRPRNTLALLHEFFEESILLHPYKCCSIAMCQRSSPKLAETPIPSMLGAGTALTQPSQLPRFQSLSQGRVFEAVHRWV